jgi:hypothetical protein
LSFGREVEAVAPKAKLRHYQKFTRLDAPLLVKHCWQA